MSQSACDIITGVPNDFQYISVVTMGANLTTVDDHIDAIKRWRAVYNSIR